MEYTLHGVLQILQPYHPEDDDDDTLEITPFFGASKQHLAATDSVTPAATQPTPTILTRPDTSRHINPDIQGTCM